MSSKVYVWVKASELKNIEYRKTYYAKWNSGSEIMSTGKFQESDGTFFWNDIPILKQERDRLLILSEESGYRQGWISVETPPEKKGYYLAWDVNLGSEQPMDVLFYQPYSQSWYYKADTFHPTHWQPLPSAPGENSDEK